MSTTNQSTEETTPPQTFEFGADISQLMNLIINAFYSSKDVFLRELISNASDALDKIRYKSLTDVSILGDDPDLTISIRADKENGVLIISDSGIGMSRDDLVNNIGTIAKSGTKAFTEALSSGKDLSMIGQFGVGFYSAFLVADNVRVVTRRQDGDHDTTYAWESDAKGAYTISTVDGDDHVKRGTQIFLHLKEDAKEYLEYETLTKIVNKHSQFIDFPILLEVEKSEEVTDDEDDEEDKENDSGDTIKDVTEESTETKKTHTVVTKGWETLNKQAPIWTRKADAVTDDEHIAFYKTIANDHDTFAAKTHFHVEGQFEFTGLLYIPKQKAFDMFQEVRNKKNNVKLHVRRVFITDECKDMMPEYLNFICGVVDSLDLPLNVSREMLQQSKVIQVIRKSLIKKSLEMIASLEGAAFDEFYTNFGKCIKLGIHEDSVNRDKLSKLIRFPSTTAKLTSLTDYVSRMKDGQPGIYYITGESVDAVSDSPFIEMLQKKEYEVLYLCDPIDEYAVQQLNEFDGKKLLCATKEGTDFGEKVAEDDTKDFAETCKKIQEILTGKVQKVTISNRMDNSPCCLTTGDFGWSANMERIIKAQALGDDKQQMYMRSQKTLEINPSHKICRKIKECINDSSNASQKVTNDLINLLYDTALITSGFTLQKPAQFANRIHRLVSLGLDLDGDEELPALDPADELTNDEQLEQVD